MTPRNTNLPSRRNFLRDNLVVHDKCAICTEPFDTEHQAASIKTTNCQHTFGIECLTQWIKSDQDNHNTCPICREQLFSKIDKPEFVEGARDIVGPHYTMAHQIQTWKPAKTFVKNMWRAMYRLYERDQVIYDSDVEEHINARMVPGFYIFSDHWPGIREEAQRMVREHYRNGSYVPLIGMQLRYYLYNVESVLEWQIGDEESEHEVSGDEPSDDEASDVEDGDDDLSMADSTE